MYKVIVTKDGEEIINREFQHAAISMKRGATHHYDPGKMAPTNLVPNGHELTEISVWNGAEDKLCLQLGVYHHHNILDKLKETK